MKKFVRFCALFAGAALLLGLASCKDMPNTKMILGDTFVSEAEKAGFTVTDMMTEEYAEDFHDLYEAVTEQIYIQYFFAKDEMVANYLYTNDYNELTEQLSEDSNRDEVTNSSFAKLAVTFADGRRVVVVRSGSTYMYLEASAEGRAAVDNFLKAISY